MGVRRIGIAGYMGAGKTAAARLLSSAAGPTGAGAVVIDADYEAKMIMSDDPGMREQLIRAFGCSILEKDRLSFRSLGNIVFASKEKLLRLNAIVHPPLVERLRGLLEHREDRGVILDAAVLPLWNMETLFDACLWIHAPFEIRLGRLKKVRRDLDVRTLRERMRVQEECLPAPPCPPWRLIHNGGSMERLAGDICIL
ncbi:MAG: dephospho-CoA kinase [Chitinispirillaceae bacterium]|nr:dephospho-CoA kinase [Chitinispirillaceae bacterium]